MRALTRRLFGSTADVTSSTSQRCADTSLRNDFSLTSKNASCSRAERQGATTWVLKTLPVSLLLVGIGYSQDAEAQSCTTPPNPPNQLVADGCSIILPNGGTFNTPPLVPAVSAINDGSIEVTGGNLIIVAARSPGAQAAGIGSEITLSGATTQIIVSGDFSKGLYATAGGSIIGSSRPAILATGGINLNGGLYADSGGRITLLNGFDVTASGFNSSAVGADGAGSFVDATHGSRIAITASAPDTAGVLMLRGGLVQMDATTILNAQGAGVAGVKIDGTTVPFGTMDNLTINLIGDPNSTSAALGLWATNQITRAASVVNVSGLTVQGPSPRSLGLFTIASTINATNSTIIVNGDGGAGAAAALNGGQIHLTNSTLRLNGAGAAAVRARNDFGETAVNQFTAVGGSISSPQAPAIVAQGALLDATLSDGVVVSGDGRLVSAVARNGISSIVNLSANSGAILTGDASADAVSTLNMTMAGGTTWTGAALDVNELTLIDSTWNLTGNSTVATLVNDPSVIDFAAPVGDPTLPSSYKTLTVNNYSGDGTIALNTYLGTDGSPSDRLVVDGGTAIGTTRLRFDNTTGQGALTTGDGILVVDAINNGTTASGAFAGFKAAGPYDYLLYRGGMTPGSENDFFLRSSTQPVPSEPLVPGGPSVPGEPGEPSRPRFRQEVSVYAAMPAAAAVYGRQIIDTLHERMGGDAQRLGAGDNGTDAPDGIWSRVIGLWGQRDGPGVAAGGPSFDYDFYAFQFGADLFRAEDPNNGSRDNAGLYAALGRGKVDVEHNLFGFTFDGGDDEFKAYSVGGYWTHFGKNDWYVDSVLQATWYDATMSGLRGLREAETDGWGLAASIEGGYPFDLGNGWLIEPQAQLVYQFLDLNDFNDGAADVRYSDQDSLAGRIGARLARSWNLDEAQTQRAGTGIQPLREASLWARADVWNEFLGQPTTEFSSANGFIPFTADLEGGWWKLGVGGTYDINTEATVYANVNYESAFDGDADAWEGKLGLKIQW